MATFYTTPESGSAFNESDDPRVEFVVPEADTASPVEVPVENRPQLHLVQHDEDEPEDRTPEGPHYRRPDEENRLLSALIRTNNRGQATFTGTPSTRLLAMLRAYFFAVSCDGDVWLTPRDSWTVPKGGILRPLEEREIIQRAQARYTKRFPDATIPTEATVRTALGALAGEATRLSRRPWLRWGRGDDEALWWDAGRADGRCVRVDAGGWTVEDKPACWFVRTPSVKELPLPEPGTLDELWAYVTVEPADRPLVVAWMLASTQPERARAAGVLYLSGPEGAGKSSAADKITEAAGSSVNRKKFDPRKDDRDLLVAAASSWILSMDNLSSLTAEQQDLLCVLVTGFEETYRRLFTTVDTMTLDLRRPVTATSIEIPVLRPDLISRMVPVELAPLGRVLPEDELSEAWAEAQPRVFGSLLTLLSRVMAAGRPRVENLPRLAVLGRMAAVADSIRGTETLGQLALRQSNLLGDSVSDDPFFDRLRSVVTGRWQGSASQLDRHLDPDGDLARRWGKQWPTGKGITARLKRHRNALERQGWILAAEHNGNKGQIWTLVSPAGPTDYPSGDNNGRAHGRGCHCHACPHPVPECLCDDCHHRQNTETL